MTNNLNLVKIEFDDDVLHRIFEEKIKEYLNQIKPVERIFYTMKDLSFLTGLSQATIYNKMINDPRLPKRKVGNKWLFKVEETNIFLDLWIDEFPAN